MPRGPRPAVSRCAVHSGDLPRVPSTRPLAAWPVRSADGDAAEEEALVAGLRVTAAACPADARLAIRCPDTAGEPHPHAVTLATNAAMLDTVRWTFSSSVSDSWRRAPTPASFLPRTYSEQARSPQM